MNTDFTVPALPLSSFDVFPEGEGGEKLLPKWELAKFKVRITRWKLAPFQDPPVEWRGGQCTKRANISNV